MSGVEIVAVAMIGYAVTLTLLIGAYVGSRCLR